MDDVKFLDDGSVVVGKQKYSGDITLESFFDNYGYYRKEQIYPNGYRRVIFCNNPRFKVKSVIRKKVIEELNIPNEDISELEYSEDLPEVLTSVDKSSDRVRNDNILRTERTVEDILLLNNDLCYFVTVTFDPEKVDGTNVDAVMKKCSNWLYNQSKRKGLKYIFVPEYHPQKNENRIHLHGCVNDVFNLVDSNTRILEGYKKPMKLEKIKRLGLEARIKSVVYNIPEWKYGWSTAIPTYGSRLSVAMYVSKYIGKAASDNGKIFGKMYWSSKNIERLPEIKLVDDDGLSFALSKHKEYDPGFGDKYKYNKMLGDITIGDDELEQLYQAVFPDESPLSGDRSNLSKLHAIEDHRIFKTVQKERQERDEYFKRLFEKEAQERRKKQERKEKREAEKQRKQILEEERRRQIKIEDI